jgi:hypothetical protein
MTWMFSIVSREYLINELIAAVYNENGMGSRGYSYHDFALLSTALAIGALVDLRLAPYNEEAQRYYRAASAAWSAAQLAPAKPTIAAVKCLHLMSIYHGLTDNGSDFKDSHRLLNSAWQIIHHVISTFQDFTR